MSDATDRLQTLCEEGQHSLMRTDYLAAEAALEEAEALARAADDLDTLGRLYFPLQEARRQRRQVCGEGTVRLDLWALNADDHIDAGHVLENFPHGQLLVAGWADLGPSLAVRKLARERGLYVETYLGAVYPVVEDGSRKVIALVPNAEVALPPAETALGGNVEALIRRLPPFSLALSDDELPRGAVPGTPQTFAETMRLWEQLHEPFLTAARQTPDPRRRIDAYRKTIDVDYACEKAHQWLAETALQLARDEARQRRTGP